MSAAGRRNALYRPAIGPTLREQGMIFVGIDVIGDWLTEINVTSPTGIQEIDRFDGISIEAMIWDSIQARLGGGRPASLTLVGFIRAMLVGSADVLADDRDRDEQEGNHAQQIEPALS